MNETRTTRRLSAWWVVAAVVLAAAVLATVAMASGGSGSTGSGTTGSGIPSLSTGGDPRGWFTADDTPAASDDCPGHDGSGGGGGSTTPATPAAPSSPSTQDGSSSPAF